MGTQKVTMTNTEEIKKRLDEIEWIKEHKLVEATGIEIINELLTQLRASLEREEKTNKVYMMNRHALEDVKKERDEYREDLHKIIQVVCRVDIAKEVLAKYPREDK